MAKMKANAVVITAHGRLDKTKQMKLPDNLLTSCKLGETHHGSHLDFSKLSIFTNKYFLYNHILTGYDDYTNQGEVIDAGTSIPQILLYPCKDGESIKRWSWQKPQIVEHFKKMAIYEVKNIVGSPFNITHENFSDAVSTLPSVTLLEYAIKSRSVKLSTHLNILRTYEEDSVSSLIKLSPQHTASLTIMKSSGICIFDYAKGPCSFGNLDPQADESPIQFIMESIKHYCNNTNIDVVGLDSYILKACLE